MCLYITYYALSLKGEYIDHIVEVLRLSLFCLFYYVMVMYHLVKAFLDSKQDTMMGIKPKDNCPTNLQTIQNSPT